MVYGFYFRFLKYTHNKWISIFLSKIAYVLYLIKYWWKKEQLPKSVCSMPGETARELIQNVYPDPCGRAIAGDAELNDTIDLSIIVPVYNYVNLIDGNIQSVLQQKTKYKFELILVDDGSTDGARDIVLKYKDHPQVKVILEENRGIAGARNNGLDHSSGKYIMFIDCDDTIHDDMVETLMARAYEQDCDIVMCAHNLSKEKDGVVYNVIPNIYPDKNLYGYKNNDYIMNFAGLPWCKVYKRELWEKVRFLPGYWYEDTIIQFLIFSQCKKFSYIPKVCYEYRWYEKNFSHVQGKSRNPKVIDRYWMLLELIEEYKRLGLPLDGKFYTLLLKHVSAYYYPTISKQEKEIVEALFILACELVEKYRPKEGCKLPYMLRETEYAMMKRDINLWKLSCHYQ